MSESGATIANGVAQQSSVDYVPEHGMSVALDGINKFGRLGTPTWIELLMGFEEGWTDLEA